MQKRFGNTCLRSVSLDFETAQWLKDNPQFNLSSHVRAMVKREQEGTSDVLVMLNKRLDEMDAQCKKLSSKFQTAIDTLFKLGGDGFIEKYREARMEGSK